MVLEVMGRGEGGREEKRKREGRKEGEGEQWRERYKDGLLGQQTGSNANHTTS